MRLHESSDRVLDELIKNVSSRSGVPEMPTGIMELDELIWGIHKKELLIIGARPSHGKTSLALQIAWNVSSCGNSVIMNSLEMSRESIIERLICSVYGINGWRLRKGVPEEVKKFHLATDKMRANLLKNSFEIVDYSGRAIEETKQILETFKPDALFIDHVQKISSRGFGSKYEALANFSHRLQDLAIEYNVAIVLNSQLQRGGEFLKGAGELEECCDALLYCKWPIRDNDMSDPKDYEICVEKQRHGPCDSTHIDFDGGTYRFSSRATLCGSERLIRDIEIP